MIEYIFNHNDRDGFIKIVKDYSLQITKLNNKFLITKKEEIDSEKKSSRKLVHSLSGHITAENVYTQLANIKHIGFEVTDACNLNCTYCIYGKYYNNYESRTNKPIDIEKAKLLIDYLIDKLNSPANNSSRNEVFISFYGGEPLLNIGFIKEIVYYSRHMQTSHIKFNYVITTNAIYLKKYFSFLFQYDFTILVSLDGSKENDAHRKFFNGKSSFSIVYKNIKHIQNNYPDYFEKKIWFNAVMHNLNNRQDIFSFFYHEFGKVPHFSEVNSTGIKEEFKNDFENLVHPKPSIKDKKQDGMMNRVLDLNASKSEQLQHFIFDFSGNIFDDYNELLAPKEQVKNLPTATCIPFSKRIFMTVNNKIFPCERIGHQFSLGKVTDRGVEIDCEGIASKYNSYYDLLRKQCERCFRKKNCTQCMFNVLKLGEDFVCDQFTNQNEFNKYFQNNMKILANQPELYKRILEEIIIIK